MAPAANESEQRQTAGKTYEIRIHGQVSDALVADLGASRRIDTDTSLLVTVSDRAAVHDVIARCEDLGLTVISINPGNPEQD